MRYGTVLCLGDSLTYGARCPIGWPELLPDALAALDPSGTEWAALNRGVCAETTRDVLLRAPAAMRELTAYGGPKVAVLLVGTNDAKGDGLDHDVWTTVYRQVVHWLRRPAVPVVLCTLPPVDGRSMPVFTGDALRWIARANRAVWAVAAGCATSLVRVADLSDLTHEDLVDGVHLSSAAHAAVARRVAEAIAGPTARLFRSTTLATRAE